ncbi:winged helix-turn-helix domain-containing protein [Natrononativus amylolyticus]|uniref:winged helix-turn-helix domain-containing protein n=1 Tax=Natrononativus amylolyticus TaxID=2963434 RepID=UPI0020CCEB8E|nr:helix-turn-helix domain-containing protein [Natrononativus amylolyticus]
MSQSQYAVHGTSPGFSSGPDVLSLETGAREILSAFDDADCRTILEVVGDDDGLSASEISDRSDVPLSTTYRKLETLTEAGLLDQQLRIRRSGKHTREYTRRIEDVRISVDDGGIELHVSRCADSSSPLFA